MYSCWQIILPLSSPYDRIASMPKNFTKKKVVQKLGFRTPDFFKRKKKYKFKKVFTRQTGFRGTQHRG